MTTPRLWKSWLPASASWVIQHDERVLVEGLEPFLAQLLLVAPTFSPSPANNWARRSSAPSLNGTPSTS